MAHWFTDYMLPGLVVGAVAGEFGYLICARVLYEYAERHYPDLVLMREAGEERDLTGFIRMQRHWRRSRAYRRIEARWWQWLFQSNFWLGWFAVCCMVLLLLAFALGDRWLP
ncbi:hypothetical protein N8I74_06940 [Chitiniphilus purpureus]|uniref:Phosphatase PAP2 family protein n=1 Tax=Chitiniphilus purpureus TaxID=2981137 RepID=A0ABY6DQU5_9NEIS|nr:hypothetical protein [Chitiniphilus sp. CD1]UXY16750.1 hypothetical protein N8I74_06940 [Chitiniphilus sp. CD1]